MMFKSNNKNNIFHTLGYFKEKYTMHNYFLICGIVEYKNSHHSRSLIKLLNE